MTQDGGHLLSWIFKIALQEMHLFPL